MLCSLQRPLNDIMTASNNLDSSVMITSVREFRNPNRRGAAIRMNSDALEFVSNFWLNCMPYKNLKMSYDSSKSFISLDV